MNLINISFIICHRPDEKCKKTIDSIKSACQKAKIDYQVLLVSGNCPSFQRNEAAKKAIYSWLYFLDNDSILGENSLIIVQDFIEKNKDAAILGGPSLLPNFSYLKKLKNLKVIWQLSVNEVLSHPLLVGKFSSRYSSRGENRITDEGELILCNMMIDKKSFQELNGFNSALYPNEENEFIVRVKKKEKKIYHLPQMIVYRYQRENLKKFISQMLNYGRGRAEQIKISKIWFRLSTLFSLFFPFFIIITSFLTVLKHLVFSHPFVFTLFRLGEGSLILYFCILCILCAIASKKNEKFLFHFPLITLCCHFFYSIGIWKYLFIKGYKSEQTKKWFKITLNSLIKN